MKILVTLAGRGSRFAGEDVRLPKPLIEVHGRPMVAWALDGVLSIPHTEVIAVALQDHESAFGITSILAEIVRGKLSVVLLDQVTDGQLCSALAARQLIDGPEDLLVTGADTWIRSSLGAAISGRSRETRGIICVADLPGDRWSFARTDALGRVVEVAEKRRISSLASAGLYYFSSGEEFVAEGEAIVESKRRTLNEFYVMPVYERYIARGWRVEVSTAESVIDMGTPSALQDALRHFDAHD